jgi:RHS repeat-associated protein
MKYHLNDRIDSRVILCILLVVGSLVFLAASPAAASPVLATPQIWCVQAPAQATGAPCTNPTSFATIQDAVNAAADGDSILVASGTYPGASPSVVSVGVGVTITGGYAGGASGWNTPSSLASNTVIDGQGNDVGVTVQGNATVTLQNLAVTNGGIENASGTVDVGANVVGNSSLILENGGTTSGAFVVPGGAVVEFPSGAQSLANGTSFTGDGLVKVDDGTVTVGSVTGDSLTLKNVELDSGALAGPGSLAVSGTFTWIGGTLGLSGSTTVDSHGSLLINETSNKTLDGGTLIVKGPTTDTFQTGQLVVLEDGAALDNQGTFSLVGDADFAFSGLGGQPTFTNEGTLVKTSGTGTSIFGLNVVSPSGSTLEVQSGTLELTRGGTFDGTVQVDSGGSLTFGPTSSPMTIDGSLSSAGTIDDEGSPVTISGSGALSLPSLILGSGTLTLSTPSTSVTTLTFNGGTLNGTSALTVSGAFNWSNGSLGLTGTTTVGSTGSLGIQNNGEEVLDGATLVVLGPTTEAVGTGFLDLENGAVFENHNTFTLAGDVGISSSSLSTNPTFKNEGTLVKASGSGTSQLNVNLLTESGATLEVQSGTVELHGGSTTDGTVQVDPGTTLTFINFAVSNAFDPSGVLLSTGTVDLEGGTLTINSQSSLSLPALVLDGGTLNLGAPTTVGGLTLNGATVNGASPLTVSGTFDWKVGTLGLSGTTTVQSGGSLAIDNVAAETLDGGTLLVQGPTTESDGPGLFNLADGAVLDNQGAFSVVGDAGIRQAQGATGTFKNEGTFTKTSGTGISFFGASVVNEGGRTIEVQTGTLRLAGGGASDGALQIDPSATLDFGGGTYNVSSTGSVLGGGSLSASNGSTTVGSGTALGISALSVTGGSLALNSASPLTIDSASVQGGALAFNLPTVSANSLTLNGGTLNGSSALTVSGAFNWSNGTLGLTGTTTVGSTGSLAIQNNGEEVLNGATLVVLGPTIEAVGSGFLDLENGAVFENHNTFTLAGDVGINSSSLSTNPTFKNEGTLVKVTGSGTSQLNVNLLTESGATLEVQSGTVELHGGSTTDGTVQVDAGTTLRFTNFAVSNTFDPSSRLVSTGTVDLEVGTLTINSQGLLSLPTLLLNGGTLNLGTAATVGNLTLDTATVNGASPLTVSGTFDWKVGTLGLSGTTTVQSSGSLAIDNVAAETLDGGTLLVQGPTTESDGPGLFNLADGAVLDNQGAFSVVGDAGIRQAQGTTGTFKNEGTFTKTSGTGISVFTVSVVNANVASIAVQSGTISVPTLTSAGQIHLASGTRLSTTSSIVQTAGAITAADQSVLGGPVDLQGGALLVSGPTFEVDNLLAVEGSSAVVIPPGTTVQFGDHAALQVAGPSGSLPGAALVLQGSSSAPITLTGTSGTAGQWAGLLFEPGSTGIVDHVELTGAGACCLGPFQIGAGIVADGASPTIGNTTISNITGAEIGVADGGLPVLRNDSFGPVSGNSAVVVQGWTTGMPLVDAIENWWGDPSGPSGFGPGTGVPIGTGVFVNPWLCAPLTDCSSAAGSQSQQVRPASPRPAPAARAKPTPAPSPTRSAAGAATTPRPATSFLDQALGLLVQLLGGSPAVAGENDPTAATPSSIYLPFVPNGAHPATPGPTSTPTATSAVAPTATASVTATTSPVGSETSTPTAAVTRTPTSTGTSTSVPTVTSTFTNGAPALDRSVFTNLAAASQFLYTGPNPVQVGVNPTVIAPQRVAVVRGRVLDGKGNALPGVTIGVLNHPEFGTTTSQVGGDFNLVVNGGGPLTLTYSLAGSPPVQRQLTVPWQDYIFAPDVVMLPYDPTVSAIDLGAAIPIQVARGSVISDTDGLRQATLFFPEGTSAQLTFANGQTQPLTGTIHVHATEFTVGPNGPSAMPGLLPVNSGYTYATEFTIDEAQQAGAQGVSFSPSVVEYLDNFLTFPIGDVVPVGSYDRTRGAWVASPNGVVLKILSVTNGAADLDVDGSGQPASPSVLASFGISDAERAELATLYPVGKSLWRVTLPHFSGWSLAPQTSAQLDSSPPPPSQPWDFNQGISPPPDAAAPNQPPPVPNAPPNPPDPCAQSGGSTIMCESQALGEDVAVVGAPGGLHYRSNRVPGFTNDGLLIPLTGANLPGDISAVDLGVTVAGQQFYESFEPKINLTYDFEWNGLDGYGRPVQGAQTVAISIGYRYNADYKAAAASSCNAAQFGHFTYCGNSASENPSRTQVSLIQNEQGTVGGQTSNGLTLGGWDARGLGLGGWTIDPVHAYDPVGKVLYRGDGTQAAAQNLAHALGSIASLGRSASVTGLAVAPDGTLYLAASGQQEILRLTLSTGGSPVVVAGTGVAGFAGDGGPAAQAQLNSPRAVAVGPDGSVYVADTGNNRVRKIAPNGTMTTVTGTGLAGFSGDNGPAALGQLNRPTGVAVAPDGTIYIADTGNNRIRQIGPDGIISTAVGTGNYGTGGDGATAAQATLNVPVSVATDPSGSLIVLDQFNQRVRKIGGDGIVRTVAGTGVPGFGGDGGAASAGQLSVPWTVAGAADGSLVVADFQNFRVRSVATSGTIGTAVGLGPCIISTVYCPVASGDPATDSHLDGPGAVAVAPDGTTYVADYFDGTVWQVTPPLPSFSAQAISVPSGDGTELYAFDQNGRHLQTVNTLTGSVIYSFQYDSSGRLSSITDANSNVTTIERDASGNPTAIVSPFGQRTTLTVDGNGFLSRVVDPAGNAQTFTYDGNGLLLARTDANGNAYSYSYDKDGRLTGETDPAGGSVSLSEVTNATQGNSRTVTMASALGRNRTYRITTASNGDFDRTYTDPSGLSASETDGADFSRQLRYPSGMSFVQTRGPDPRFAMQAPVPQSVSVALPSGLTSTTAGSRTVVLTDPANPLSLTSASETLTTNGETSRRAFEAANRVETFTSPEGRQLTLTLDVQGRVIASQIAGLVPTTYTYDAHGNVVAATQGSGADQRTTALTYDSQGFVSALVDALGETTSYSFDAAGRLLASTRPDGQSTLYGYDANGNVTSVTPPGRAAHGFTFSPVNLITGYTPPAVPDGSTQLQQTFNADRQLTGVARPDGSRVQVGYDSAGRLSSQTIGRGTYTYSYDTGTGNPDSITAPGGVAETFGYDGALLTGTTWSGPISGSVTQSYNADFHVTSQSVDGADQISYSYDGDGWTTRAGDLNLSYGGQNSLLTGTALGAVTASLAYDGFGQVTSYVAFANGTGLFSNQYSYDKLGRVVTRTESITDTTGSGTTTYGYRYDPAGRIAEVSADGTPVASYSYDPNGNRVSYVGSLGTFAGSYDAQDRLLAYGTSTYGYTLNGDLREKATNGQTTTYQYDELGNLLHVGLPDGTSIDYLVDGENHRIAKKVNGVLVEGFLYRNQLQPVAQLDGGGNVVSRFVYAGTSYAPEYLIKGGSTYRIIADQVGSPRLVVDVASGQIVQRLDYDEFGNVLRDTNPGFQPFGFAGGIYDPDTGLVRFGARDYDAQTGRWTSRDPLLFLGGGSNLYAYSLDDPVNNSDPFGTQPGLGTSFQQNFNRQHGSINNFNNCSGFVRDVLSDQGIGRPDVTANGLIDFFSNSDANNGEWSQVSQEEAIELADMGNVVVVGLKGKGGGSGHVAFVLGSQTDQSGYPAVEGTSSGSYQSDWFDQNAGNNRYVANPGGWNGVWSPGDGGRVQYWVWNGDLDYDPNILNMCQESVGQCQE